MCALPLFISLSEKNKQYQIWRILHRFVLYICHKKRQTYSLWALKNLTMACEYLALKETVN